MPGRHHAHDEALLTIEESVCRMGLDYIDLYRTGNNFTISLRV